MPPLCLGADSVTDYTPLRLPYHIALFYFGGGILKHISHWSLFPSNIFFLTILQWQQYTLATREKCFIDTWKGWTVTCERSLDWDGIKRAERKHRTLFQMDFFFLLRSNLPITCCLLWGTHVKVLNPSYAPQSRCCWTSRGCSLETITGSGIHGS